MSERNELVEKFAKIRISAIDPLVANNIRVIIVDLDRKIISEKKN